MKIAIVAGRFNQAITENLVKGAQKALGEQKVPVYWIPGAYELPLACQLLSEKHDALIAVGAVIRGETSHFDYVCEVASRGIAEVSRQKEIPIGFGVITADTVRQAAARSADNDNNFGYKAAMAAIDMLNLKKKINE